MINHKQIVFGVGGSQLLKEVSRRAIKCFYCYYYYFGLPQQDSLLGSLQLFWIEIIEL
jgi:hypothetical protein